MSDNPTVAATPRPTHDNNEQQLQRLARKAIKKNNNSIPTITVTTDALMLLRLLCSLDIVLYFSFFFQQKVLNDIGRILRSRMLTSMSQFITQAIGTTSPPSAANVHFTLIPLFILILCHFVFIVVAAASAPNTSIPVVVVVVVIGLPHCDCLYMCVYLLLL